MTTTRPSALQRCKLPGCTVHFTPPPSARNKEFCCANHRLQFHSAERKAAMTALREAQERASKGAGQ